MDSRSTNQIGGTLGTDGSRTVAFVRENSVYGHDAEWLPRCRCKAKVSCWIKLIMSIGLSTVLCWYWNTVDSGDSDFTPSGYTCASDFEISKLDSMDLKGMTVDDATFGCPNEIPVHWPNTKQKVKLLRLFRSSQLDWDQARIFGFATSLSQHAALHNLRVLVGTQITCNEQEDDADWTQTMDLLQMLGADHVLGVAVGNELDLLHQNGASPECIRNLWGGYLVRKVQSRMQALRALQGFENIPVTSVFTGGVIWDSGKTPYVDTKNASVNTFFKEIRESGEKHWVFTFNFYPYFDPTLKMDLDGKHCTNAISSCSCFDKTTCLNLVQIIQARKKLKRLTGNDDDRFWIGELGWSAPAADTLSGPMMSCAAFSSYPTLRDYYANFLKWDLDVGRNYAPPEHVFYFTMRDSSNFGKKEYFGLIETCGSSQCKLTNERVTATLPVRSNTTDHKASVFEIA